MSVSFSVTAASFTRQTTLRGGVAELLEAAEPAAVRADAMASMASGRCLVEFLVAWVSGG